MRLRILFVVVAVLVAMVSLANADTVEQDSMVSDGNYMCITPGSDLAHQSIYVDYDLEKYRSVKDYGAVGDGSHDDTQAINDALTDVASDGFGAYSPDGVYKTTSMIAPVDNVKWRGESMYGTVIKGYGSGYSLIYKIASVESPVTRFNVTDITLDGSNVIDATYTAFSKAIYIQYMSDCHISRVYAYNTSATGIGTDYMTNGCTIKDSVAEKCGRMFPGYPSRGGNGIGIGTGEYEVEDVLIENCTAIYNGDNGIMFENQALFHTVGYHSRAGTVINCTSNYNGFGYRTTGDWNATFIDCVGNNNTYDGMVIDWYMAYQGFGHIISNSTFEYNGRMGINMSQLNCTTITGCKIDNNGWSGIYMLHATNDNVFNDNVITDNGQTPSELFPDANMTRCGVYVAKQTGAAWWTNSSFCNNTVYDTRLSELKTQRYGLFLNLSGWVNNVVTGNHVTGNSVAGMRFSVAGTNNTISDNEGYL